MNQMRAKAESETSKTWEEHLKNEKPLEKPIRILYNKANMLSRRFSMAVVKEAATSERKEEKKAAMAAKKVVIRNKRRLNKKTDLAQLSMCIPAFIKLFIFSYLPMVGIILAFEDYKPRQGLLSPWVGLENFRFFFVSGEALRATFNTVMFNVIFIISGLVVSLILALVMFEISNKFVVKLFQTVVFFPYFISWLIVGIMLAGLLGTSGTITKVLEGLTGTTYDFYLEPGYWWIILPVLNIWKGAGVSAIIYYANMLSINKEYYEAAKIDGATRLQCAFKITLPFMRTMITTLTLLSIGGIIRSDFGIFYYATRNSTLLYDVTTTIDTYVFRALENTDSVGSNTALGLFQSLVGFILVMGSNWVIRRIDRERALI